MLSEIAQSRTQDAVIHHAANAAAVAIPAGAAVFHLPDILTIMTAIAGLLWYAILISEKVALWFRKYRQFRQSSHRVATKLNEERHGELPPSAG